MKLNLRYCSDAIRRDIKLYCYMTLQENFESTFEMSGQVWTNMPKSVEINSSKDSSKR